MTKQQLEEKLSASLETYKNEIGCQLDEYSKEPVTKGELCEVAKQVFYVLNDYKNLMLEYLE